MLGLCDSIIIRRRCRVYIYTYFDLYLALVFYRSVREYRPRVILRRVREGGIKVLAFKVRALALSFILRAHAPRDILIQFSGAKNV